MSKRKYKICFPNRKRKTFSKFLEDLDNEDEDYIFENTNLHSDRDTSTDMDELDPTAEGDLN